MSSAVDTAAPPGDAAAAAPLALSPGRRLLRAKALIKFREAVRRQIEINRAAGRRVRRSVSLSMAESADKLREMRTTRREITVAQYYLLTAATLLLVLLVIYALLVRTLKLLARVEVVWWLTRSAKMDDFRLWTQEVCADPWQHETVLCQAVDGSWLARSLIMAKLQEASADHCDPEMVPNGCRHEPCPSKGLSQVLLGLADSWTSPLNNRLHPVYYALLPLRTRLRELLRGIAYGRMPLSVLNREVEAFPLLERGLPFGLGRSSGSETAKDYLLNEIVFPIVRTWGVVFGGSRTRPASEHSCPGAFDFGLPNREERGRVWRTTRRVLSASLTGGRLALAGVGHAAVHARRSVARQAASGVSTLWNRARRARRIGQAKLKWELTSRAGHGYARAPHAAWRWAGGARPESSQWLGET